MFVLTCPVVLSLRSSHLPAPPSRVVLPVSVEEVSTNGGPCLKMNHEEKFYIKTDLHCLICVLVLC